MPAKLRKSRKTVSLKQSGKSARAKLREYRLIDLFSGCGGMTLGFVSESLVDVTRGSLLNAALKHRRKSAFRPVFANDFDDVALATYRANFDREETHSKPGSIEALLKDRKLKWPKADVVIGGPPCQGFSLLNKEREGDERRQLWWHFMEVAERVGSKVIVMENVPQLFGTPEFDAMLKRLRQLGYHHLMAHKLCAANYGVAQVRHRAIVIASRCGPIALPLPSHLSPDRLLRLNGDLFGFHPTFASWRNVRQEIGDLVPPEGTEIRVDADQTQRLHFGRNPTDVSLSRYRLVPEGGNRFDLQKNSAALTPACWIRKTSGGTDLFGRLWWERPSVTIRTEFFKPEKGRYLHPDQHRPITHREAARLQSFPDDFKFTGSKIEIAKQIGNAVPPLLAAAISESVRDCLEGKTTVADMQAVKHSFSKLLGETITEVWFGETVTKK